MKYMIWFPPHMLSYNSTSLLKQLALPWVHQFFWFVCSDAWVNHYPTSSVNVEVGYHIPHIHLMIWSKKLNDFLAKGQVSKRAGKGASKGAKRSGKSRQIKRAPKAAATNNAAAAGAPKARTPKKGGAKRGATKKRPAGKRSAKKWFSLQKWWPL